MIRFRLLILALLFKVTALSAQSTLGGVYPIAPNFGKADFRDLEAFKKEVSDARIVFLGDMIHGESNIDSARIYIIKMLIEEMGFDVLAFESGIYDLYKAELLQKEGMGIAQAVQESVFPVWTGYDSFRPLLEYLESKNGEIKTIGFDPQRSGAYASEITDDLAEFLNQCGVKYEESVLEDWDYMCADLLDFTLHEDFSKLYFNLINKVFKAGCSISLLSGKGGDLETNSGEQKTNGFSIFPKGVFGERRRDISGQRFQSSRSIHGRKPSVLS